MQTPINPFLQALRAGQTQIGLWVGLADGYSAEILGGVGYDWLLVDGEHAPNDLRSILVQLQAIDSARRALPGRRSEPVVRLPVSDTALVKQYLDLGVQTLLVPMVDSAEQAALLVQAMRYPQADGRGGVRGLGSAMARASRWQQYPDYVQQANAQVCLLVQAESVMAMQNLEAIAATEGVDGVFIGPADLSCSMGHPGQADHPAVVSAITEGIARIRACGKAAGILATQEADARRWLAAGARFVAVGVDTMLLSAAASDLLARFRGPAAPVHSGY